MKIIYSNIKLLFAEYTNKEVLIMNNSLNEVSHGLKIDNFLIIMGFDRLVFEKLFLKKIAPLNLGDGKIFSLKLNWQDIELIEKAIKKVMDALHDQDLHTRVGVTRAEIETFLNELETLEQPKGDKATLPTNNPLNVFIRMKNKIFRISKN